MDIVIVGAGGHGKVVCDILRAGKKFKPVGFIDADESLKGTKIAGLPVFGPVNQLVKLRKKKIKGAIIAIGDNRARAQYAAELIESGFTLVNAIHPTATIAKTATLGMDVVIAAGAVVCTEARIGDSSIVNTNAVVDHECEVGANVHICPGALLAGRVRVGDGSFIGLGAKIIQCLTIGRFVTIGAGAVVISDVADGATVVGVPGRVIKTTDVEGPH